MTKLIHPSPSSEKLVKKNELGESFTLVDHQREVLRLAFDFNKDRRLPCDTILYSCIKKPAGALSTPGLLWAGRSRKRRRTSLNSRLRPETGAAPRVCRIEGFIRYNDPLKRECEVQSPRLWKELTSVPIRRAHCGLFHLCGTQLRNLQGDSAGDLMATKRPEMPDRAKGESWRKCASWRKCLKAMEFLKGKLGSVVGVEPTTPRI